MNSTFGKGFGIKKYPGNNDSFEVESRGSDLDKTNNADLAFMLNHPSGQAKNKGNQNQGNRRPTNNVFQQQNPF
jgi:hypothetical protein